MRGNSFGEVFVVTTFGESHGTALGAVVDGCPAGVVWRPDVVERAMARRRPGQNALVSARAETDEVQILSGVYQDKTLGTPIAGVIFNRDANSIDYDSEAIRQRRGHANDVWHSKFNHSDPRGSGRASGRETVSRVFAGAVAQMLVEQLRPQIKIVVFTSEMGGHVMARKSCREWSEQLRTQPDHIDQSPLRCPDKDLSQAMETDVVNAKANGESFGGAAWVQIFGLPVGLGEPVFAKLKSQFAKAFLSVGATTALELGDGIESATSLGADFHSENQAYGGLRGGLSTGEPVEMKVYFKPTSSRQEVARAGRHDPFIVPRAVPVLEAMSWIVLADALLISRLDII